MFEKILNKFLVFGTTVAYDYMNMEKRWVALILMPVYMAFVMLYVTTLLLLVLVYVTWNVVYGEVTFREAWEAFKQGCSEGSEELEEHFKGMES